MPTAAVPRDRISLPVILTLALIMLLGPPSGCRKVCSFSREREACSLGYAVTRFTLPDRSGGTVSPCTLSGSILMLVAILAGISAYPTFVESATDVSAPHLVPVYIVLVWGVSWFATLPLRTVYDVAHIRLHRLFRRKSGNGKSGTRTKRVVRRSLPSSQWIAPPLCDYRGYPAIIGGYHFSWREYCKYSVPERQIASFLRGLVF